MGTLTPTRLDPAITATLREAADGVRAASGARIGDMVEGALLRTLTDTITLKSGILIATYAATVRQ